MKKGIEEQGVVPAEAPPKAAVTIAVPADSLEASTGGGAATPVVGLLVVVVLACVAIMRRPTPSD